MSSNKDKLKEAKLRRTLSLIAFSIAIVVFALYELGFCGDIENDLSTELPQLGSFTESDDEGELDFSSAKAMFCCIDVGQGDCLLVVSGENAVLIDAGNRGDGNKIADFLWNLGVDDIDLAVCSHPHSDHIGGMDEIILEYAPDKLIYPDIPSELVSTDGQWGDVLEAADMKEVETEIAVAGDIYTVGDIKLSVLSPWGDETYTDLNEWSMALLIEVQGVEIFSAGDLSRHVENGLLSVYPLLYADICKASHHGSSDANGVTFLRALEPDYVCISCGKDNDYGHPHEETISTLNELGIDYKRTDISGDIVYLLADGEIAVWTDK